jgi:hypothetical protein
VASSCPKLYCAGLSEGEKGLKGDNGDGVFEEVEVLFLLAEGFAGVLGCERVFFGVTEVDDDRVRFFDCVSASKAAFLRSCKVSAVDFAGVPLNKVKNLCTQCENAAINIHTARI